MSRKTGLAAGVFAIALSAVAGAACASFSGNDAPSDEDASPEASLSPEAEASAPGDDGAPARCGAIVSFTSDGGVPAGETDCGGVPVQLLNNPDHCGACGHSCRGNACNGGICKAKTLTTDPAGVIGSFVVGADDGYVYWIRYKGAVDTTLTRIALGAGAQPQILLPTMDFIAATALTPDRAYAGFRGGGIAAVPLGGGPGGGAADATTIVTFENTSSLAARADDVFFASEASHHVRHVASDGGDPTEIATDEPAPTSLLAEDRAVFWINRTEDGGADGGPGSLVRYDRGTKAITRSGPAGRPTFLAKDADHLYVYDGDAQALRRYRKGALDEATTMMQWTGDARPYARGMVVDNTAVYVLLGASDATGVLVEVPICGGPPLVLFRSTYAVGGIALGHNVIYMGDGATVIAVAQ